MSERAAFRGGSRGGSRGNNNSRGGRGGGDRSGGQGGGDRGGNGKDQEKPKKENILDLGKYSDKRIIVKFNGGREGGFVLFFWAFLLRLVWGWGGG